MIEVELEELEAGRFKKRLKNPVSARILAFVDGKMRGVDFHWGKLSTLQGGTPTIVISRVKESLSMGK